MEVDDWKAPRHVRDFAQQVTLPVGVKRSLFKRTVAPETIALDEYVLGGFELRDDGAEIRLRRKAEAPDSLVFNLRRTDDNAVGRGAPPGRRRGRVGPAGGARRVVGDEVERLWQLLRRPARRCSRARRSSCA